MSLLNAYNVLLIFSLKHPVKKTENNGQVAGYIRVVQNCLGVNDGGDVVFGQRVNRGAVMGLEVSVVLRLCCEHTEVFVLAIKSCVLRNKEYIAYRVYTKA